ncbi:hypothetical protein KKF91_09350 [Myxococcota bacterium]|nr:hypothetical protein [Myxococcota bacterium]MBU1430747.1 hypothetical protein [Myxococcota bacterium]MBU1897149.1 hypothetical protein [Myxococcota bacterium]
MSKDRKRKKRIKSKTTMITQAQQTKSEARRERASLPPKAGRPSEAPGGIPPEVANFERRGGGGGLLSGMRGGFKAAVGADQAKQKKGGWLDIALWIAVAVAAMFFLYKRMG